jgi:hypothetical protein
MSRYNTNELFDTESMAAVSPMLQLASSTTTSSSTTTIGNGSTTTGDTAPTATVSAL